MENQRFLTWPFRLFRKLTRIKKFFFTVLFILALLFFCRTPTTFRVLDAKTGKPIEGAVALAMWSATRGLPGLSSTYTAKAVEAESDGRGKLTIPFLFGRAAIFKPLLKVYKPGYVGWDSKFIYKGSHEKNKTIPVYQERESFSMKDQDIYLEPWKDEYTYISHDSFIQIYTNLRKDAGISKSLYEKAIRYEDSFSIKERDLNYKKGN